MRPIDADALAGLIKIHKAISSGNGWSSDLTIDFILGLIEDAPTVEAIPVEQVARMLAKVTVAPCGYGFEDYDWCGEDCGDHKNKDCWLHAIKEGLLDK